MVQSVKIFELKQAMELASIGQKLKEFREEEPCELEGKTEKCTTEILDLKVNGDELSGILSRDFVSSRYYKRKVVETLITEEVPFWIKHYEGRVFLLVLAPSKPRGMKKLLTNYVASKIGEILFSKTDSIIESHITHKTLKRLHESNPKATKLVWFDNIDIPNVGKLCLAGSALADTQLYRTYLKYGKVWYVVFEAKPNLAVGITRNCVITSFSRLEREEFLDYVLKNVLPLTSSITEKEEEKQKKLLEWF